VFLHGNVELANALFPETNWREHSAHQAGVRTLISSLRLLAPPHSGPDTVGGVRAVA